MRGFVLAVFSAALACAESPVQVNESDIRAVLRGQTTVIVVPVSNHLGHATGAALRLWWLLPSGESKLDQERTFEIAPGESRLEMPLPVPEADVALRVGYRLGDQTGIVALAMIAQHVFELKLIHFEDPHLGDEYRVHAQAVHPLTHQPVECVKWNGHLELGEKKLRPLRSGRDAKGVVEFVFAIPQKSEADSFEVEVEGSCGDFSDTATVHGQINMRPIVHVQTDKPIYQPGQTIHFRAVLLDSSSHVLDDEKTNLTIEDEEGSPVHKAELQSTKFGVIHDDWTLPASAAAGDYNLYIETGGERLAQHRIRVGQYDLPQFTVTAKTDRKAYLPGENVDLEIRGTYLFGKAVPGGKVKITTTDDTPWFKRKKTPDSDDEVIAEGTAGADGTFRAHIDIRKDHEAFEENRWKRFEDLHYAVDYTDPLSGRTEPARFDIRITKSPIHIYLSQVTDSTLPMPFYLATYYADGRPAVVKGTAGTIPFETNRYGVAKIRRASGDDRLEIRVTDAQGLSATLKDDDYRYSDPRVLLVETSKAIYRAGENVKVAVTAGPKEERVYVASVVHGKPLTTRVLNLTGGRGETQFAYQPEFQGDVSFVAWSESYSAQYGKFGGLRVMFPEATDLEISAVPARTTYRPGEKASVSFSLKSASGKPVESALGIAAVDQAVFERVRTDSEFGARHWFYCSYCTYEREAEVGGVRLNDLHNLDMKKPVPVGLDLVAEMLLAGSYSGPIPDNNGDFVSDLAGTYAGVLGREFKEANAALGREQRTESRFPRSVAEFERVLNASGVRLAELRDPWGGSFEAGFRIEGANDVIELTSAGPDKKRGTADDFVALAVRKPFFYPHTAAIQRILRPGEFPADDAAFRALVLANGMNWAEVRDPWDREYRVQVSTWRARRSISILSAGPDGVFDTRDDLQVANLSGGYFGREEEQIGKAVFGAASFPLTEEEFRKVLRDAHIDLDAMRDAWGKPYRVRVRTVSRYADRTTHSRVRIFGGTETTRTDVTPVTQLTWEIAIQSDGEDRKEGTLDDFAIARFAKVVDEKSVAGAAAARAALGLGSGSIAGTVTDSSGAVVANAQVILEHDPDNGEERRTTSDTEGGFYFDRLPPGFYTLQFDVPGFKRLRVVEVGAEAGRTTEVDAELQVGEVSQSVTVAAEAEQLMTSAASVSERVTGSTPRVRDYFPETVFWEPELLTNSAGQASVKFKLADNITTWKVAVFASTLDGRTAETEIDLRAFQPFFLDYNPPQVLTEGDEVDLPATIRNYTERAQQVRVSLDRNSWSDVLGAADRQMTIGSGSSENAVFSVRAKATADKASQRLIATSGREGDGIEKSLRVHPDGRETTQVLGDLVGERSKLTLAIPASAIPGATHAELRVYPNLVSALIESADGVLVEPHGCAEQTISAGYSNLIALRYARAMGIKDKKFELRAVRNIKLALNALPAFEFANGGVSYWGRGDPDIAVTAYAVSYLVAAREFVDQDSEQVDALIRWLVQQQSNDGIWAWRWSIAHIDEDPRRDLGLTAFVARSLAAAVRAGHAVPDGVLDKAYQRLGALADEFGEPYGLAQFSLAALDSGRADLAERRVMRLAAEARDEGTASYWDLKTNSPFYGWGFAGRAETTGLAVSALAAWRSAHQGDARFDAIIRRGILFLLRSRDRWGSWYSTQATLRAMQAIADASALMGGTNSKGGGIMSVRVNGRETARLVLPPSARASDPILLDVSSFLTPGANRVELISSAGSQTAMVRLTSTHSTPWADPVRDSKALRLSVGFDHSDSKQGEPIRCRVEAERVGFRGYGMMIAEVGLPPGSEVDRSSLEELVDDWKLGINHYEILPDRVIFYVWPSAGGVKFEFGFTPRISMRAQSRSAVLYDYYNPEERVEVPPARFTVPPR